MHIPVESGAPEDRWRLSFSDGEEPDAYTYRAFATIGYNLWPAIVASGLGGNTYARCVLASLGIAEFLKGKKYDPEVVRVICDVSLRYEDNQLVIPNTLAIGQPDEEEGLERLHVIVRVTDRNARSWIIDGSARQAARPNRWNTPPEVIIARTFDIPPAMHPDEGYLKQGYYPLAATSIDQGNGTRLLFQWVTKSGLPDAWSSTPDGAPERSERLARRLNSAWGRTKPPAL